MCIVKPRLLPMQPSDAPIEEFEASDSFKIASLAVSRTKARATEIDPALLLSNKTAHHLRKFQKFDKLDLI